MNSLGDAVGAGIPITIMGEDILLPPMGLAELGAVENELRSQRPNVLKLATEAAKSIDDPLERTAFMDRAWREAREVQQVDPREVIRYITDDINGITLTIWILLERVRPGQYSRRDVYDWLAAEAAKNTDAIKDLVRKRDMASGLSVESSPSPQAADHKRAKRRGARRPHKRRR
jgi:hypothetical protein